MIDKLKAENKYILGEKAKNPQLYVKKKLFEERNNSEYFYSSQYFSSSYKIPLDVAQDKIEYEVEGDYFTIIMPKK